MIFLPSARPSLRRLRAPLICAASIAAFAAETHAASQVWSPTPTSSDWALPANWVGNAVPGAINSSTNADVATFNAPVTVGGIGSAANPILNDNQRSVRSIFFDTADAGPYVIGTVGGNQLHLTHLGNVTVGADVVNPQVINAPISIRVPSSTNAVYSLVNNSATTSATLTLNSIFNTSASTRPLTLTLDGANTGANTIGAILDNAGANGAIILIKQGAGTWVLSGANELPQKTSAGNVAGVTVNAGTLVVQNAGSLGSISLPVVNGGTLQIDGVSLSQNSLALNNGGTIRMNGSGTVNGVTVGNAAAGIVTVATTGAGDLLTVGNAANKVTGGAADTVLRVSGPGTVALNFASNFAGSWSIDGGTVLLGSATALGAPASARVTFGAGSNGRLQLNDQNVTLASLSTNGGSAAVVENGGFGTSALTVNSTVANTFTGTLRDGTAGGNLALVVGGSAPLTLAGSNTYTGGTAVNNGATLKVTNTSGSGTGTGDVMVNLGGAIGGTGSISGVVTVSSGSQLAPGDNGVGTLTVGGLNLNSGSVSNYEITSAAVRDLTVVTGPGGLNLGNSNVGFNLFQPGSTTQFSTVGSYDLIQYNGGFTGGTSGLVVLNPDGTRNYAFSSTGSAIRLAITAAAVSTWNNTGSGSWGLASNWTGAGIPNSSGAAAVLGPNPTGITAPSTVSLNGSRTVSGVTFNNANAYTIAAGSGGTLLLDNTANAGQASFSVLNGSHSITAPVSLNSSTVASVVNAASTLTISGEVGGVASLTKSGAGTLVLSGSNSYQGGTQISAGTVAFSSQSSLGTGDLTLAGGTLRWSDGNTADISSRVVTLGTGGGTFDVGANDVVLANSIGNSGPGDLTKAGSGTLSLAGGNTYSGATRIVAGTLDILDDSSLGFAPFTAAPGLTFDPGAGNTARLRINGATTIGATRNVLLNSGTSVIDTPFGNVVLGGVITGSGALRKVGAANLTLQGANTGATGGIRIEEGNVVVGSQNNLPTGGITLTGTGGITATGAANFSGVVVEGTNSITETGSVILGLGTVTGNGSLTFGGPFVNDFTGDLNGFGGTIIARSGGYRFNGTTGGNNLTLDLATFGVSVRNSATAINLGALTGAAGSTLTGSGGGATQNVTYSIGAKNLDTEFAGNVTNGVGSTAINKVGSGTLILSGSGNGYTGSTTVTSGTLVVADAINGGLTGTTSVNVNGGEFRLGANNMVNDLAPVTIGSGTLNTAGFDESLFTLAINGSATLNLGTADSTLRFANSALNPWTGTLSITNWSGSTLGGGTDQLFFGTDGTGLTGDQLALVQFINPAGFAPGSYGAQILGTGELVAAIPEPGTLVSLLGGVGCLLGSRRRRQG